MAGAMRIFPQLIGTLLLVGFVLKYWWLIAPVLAGGVEIRAEGVGRPSRHGGRRAAQTRGDRCTRRSAARLVMAGDPRGTYGAEITCSNSSEPDTGAPRLTACSPRPATQPHNGWRPDRFCCVG